MIYLDNQSSTPIHPEVLKVITQAMHNNFANPHSQHSGGQQAMHSIDTARRIITDYLGIQFSELIFTSGATESNNIAIQGVIFKALQTQEQIEIITTPIEHSSVIETIKALQISYPERIYIKIIPIDERGIVKVEDIQSLLTDKTVLVSIIHANNEIGTIQPIRDIGRMLKKYHPESVYPLFHSDGAQAIWSEEINLHYANLDLYSISGHKMYAPKGIGALFIKKDTPIQSITYGGGQEYSLRPGTLNTPLIVGLGESFRLLTIPEHKALLDKVRLLRDTLLDKLLALEDIQLNGDRENRLPQNINIVTTKASDSLVIAADLEGLAISAGSACHSGALQASYVIQAISPPDSHASTQSIRISLSQYTSKEEIEEAYTIIKSLI